MILFRPLALRIFSVASIGFLWPGSADRALAQTARDESVQSRPRPDYDPDGIYFSDLVDGLGRVVGVVPKDRPRSDAPSTVVIYPTLTFGSYYDDNVLRTASNRRGDFVQTARAALDMSSDRDTHGFEVGGYGEVGYFSRLVSENYHQFGGYAGAFLVPSDESRLRVRLSDERLREPREDTGGATGQLRPTVYHLLTATMAGEYKNADWLLAPSGVLKTYTYQPNAPVVIGSEYDRDEYTGTFRVGHTMSEGSAVFIEPQINTRSYHEAVSPVDGFRHDSSGYQIIAGAHFDFSSVTYAEIGGGWLQQHYEDPAFKTLSGPALLATATWNPRDWITLSLDAGRQINEAVIPGVSGVETTYATATLDYELDYNWLANLNLGYITADYRGVPVGGGPERSDTILRYGVGTRYFVARGASVALNWVSYDRSSNVASADLKYNQYIVSLVLQW
ncbi:MAG: outer membrane beta-barrel protein [Alphaproteobacteria bacterium]|nr:outer membrane beta-barrel protein [Alphaproteobacteria bacterium]